MTIAGLDYEGGLTPDEPASGASIYNTDASKPQTDADTLPALEKMQINVRLIALEKSGDCVTDAEFTGSNGHQP